LKIVVTLISLDILKNTIYHDNRRALNVKF